MLEPTDSMAEVSDLQLGLAPGLLRMAALQKRCGRDHAEYAWWSHPSDISRLVKHDWIMLSREMLLNAVTSSTETVVDSTNPVRHELTIDNNTHFLAPSNFISIFYLHRRIFLNLSNLDFRSIWRRPTCSQDDITIIGKSWKPFYQ